MFKCYRFIRFALVAIAVAVPQNIYFFHFHAESEEYAILAYEGVVIRRVIVLSNFNFHSPLVGLHPADPLTRGFVFYDAHLYSKTGHRARRTVYVMVYAVTAYSVPTRLCCSTVLGLLQSSTFGVASSPFK